MITIDPKSAFASMNRIREVSLARSKLLLLGTLLAVAGQFGWLQHSARAQVVISRLPHTIKKPGVYILTKDIAYSGSTFAIDVESSDVAVNFQGFKIQGPGASGTVTGVMIGNSTSSYNVTIQDGTIEDFGVGIDLNSNLSAVSSGGQIQNMRVINTGSHGIEITQSLCVIYNNVISQCTGTGIQGFGYLLLSGNQLVGCAVGVQVYGAGYLTGNFANNCTTGFDLETSGGLVGAARFNTTTNCATPFTGQGILLTNENY
jgi:hypothetical protein